MIRPVAGAPVEQQSPAVIVRLCLWDEARGEGAIGMAAIHHVLHNRVWDRAARGGPGAANGMDQTQVKGSLAAEVLRPRQFSGFNHGTPDELAHRNSMVARALEDAPGWAAADAVATLCEAGMVMDPTRGSTHYYNPVGADPPWGRRSAGWDERATLGHHVFGVAV